MIRLPLLLDSSLHIWNFWLFFIVTGISNSKYGETSIMSSRLAPSLFTSSCSPMNNATHALSSAANHGDHQSPIPHKNAHIYILCLNSVIETKYNSNETMLCRHAMLVNIFPPLGLAGLANAFYLPRFFFATDLVPTGTRSFAKKTSVNKKP